MEVIEPVSHIEICRDPDDDKFINCARDAHVMYIVESRIFNQFMQDGGTNL